MPFPKLITKTEAERQEAFERALGRTPHAKPKKPRKRPCVKGHPGIERGSDAAADLFWAEAAKVMESKGLVLPEHRLFGFAQAPSPSSATARKTFHAWKYYARERAREDFSFVPLADREMLYWHAVDHRSMSGSPRPDPYIFGFDEIPVRPAHLPESDFVREMREFFADSRRTADFVGGRTGVDAALATLGLKPGATAAEIRRAFRKLVLTTHPDRGGTDTAFQAIVAAKNTALAHLEKPR